MGHFSKLSFLILSYLMVGAQVEAVTNLPENSISWGVYGDRPPIFITAGERQGEGIGDGFYKDIKKILPNFQHHTLNAKLLRIISKIKKESNVCTAMFKTPERQPQILFSKQGIGWVPTARVVVPTDRLDRFMDITGWESGDISLKALLKQHKSLRLGLVKGISNGADLDQLLNNLDQDNSLYLHSGFKSPLAVLRMMYAGRLDYVIQPSWMVQYLLQGSEGKVTIIPISDIRRYDEVFIGCSLGSTGAAVIEKIDTNIDQVRQYFQTNLERFLPTSELLDYRETTATNY